MKPTKIIRVEKRPGPNKKMCTFYLCDNEVWYTRKPLAEEWDDIVPATLSDRVEQFGHEHTWLLRYKGPIPRDIVKEYRLVERAKRKSKERRSRYKRDSRVYKDSISTEKATSILRKFNSKHYPPGKLDDILAIGW